VTLALYYHQLSEDPSPLSVSPDLFSRHLEVFAECGATVLTARELVEARRERALPERAVSITFDDGFAAAVAEAQRRLRSAGMRATFFCVAGHLGGRSDWPSRLRGAPVQPLAGRDELRMLAREGHEIGSHGWSHAPLDAEADFERELVASRDELAAVLDLEVRTFAYPYGAMPSVAAGALVARTYDGAFTTAAARVGPDSPLWLLPRVDAHYLRDPHRLRRAVEGSANGYLGVRRLGSRTRRAMRKDYVPGPAR
jgi:peptidoglycan/xylan/chitin deacetylase (PgdA/CDA1 family)